jgi:hypothetical protein
MAVVLRKRWLKSAKLMEVRAAAADQAGLKLEMILEVSDLTVSRRGATMVEDLSFSFLG